MLPIFGSEEYGKDEDTSKGMLRRHEALSVELEKFGDKVCETTRVVLTPQVVLLLG